MFIFCEIAFIVFLISVVVFCGRPIFEAISERIRSQDRLETIEKSAERRLENKVAFLEAEVMELKQQLRTLQETSEFAARLSQEKPAS